MKGIVLKVVLVVLGLTLLIPLWLVGVQRLTLEIRGGKLPFQTVAEAFDIAPWFPLVVSIVFTLGILVFLLYNYLGRGRDERDMSL